MQYSKNLTATTNLKGVLDIDTVKGCSRGMKEYPDGGCYGLCYAEKIANRYGIDFSKSIIRVKIDRQRIEKTVRQHKAKWFRIGTMGDPSYDWDYTTYICEWLGRFKTPVIVSKHWEMMSSDNAERLRVCNAVVNTSISPLDSLEEIEHRLMVFKWLKFHGVKSVLRVVSVNPGDTEYGGILGERQRQIKNNKPIIDNPLRIPINDARVLSGDILAAKNKHAIGGSILSVSDSSTFVGSCRICPDQCGVEVKKLNIGEYRMEKGYGELTETEFFNSKERQAELFSDDVEFEYVKSVIGSGYENDVATLAIED